MKTAYLVAGVRTPFAKSGTELKAVHPVELGRFALTELLARTGAGLSEIGGLLDEVIIGNTGTPSDSANIARVIALRAGLPHALSAYTVHRNCASGLEALSQAALKVEAGVGDVYVAGGTESMSQLPLIYNANAVRFFESLQRARTLAERAQAFAKIPVKDFLAPRISIMEGLTDPVCALNMGQTAEILAKEYKISREEQDRFALTSHQRAVAAAKTGVFRDEIATYSVPPKFEKTLAVDSGPRESQTMEQLAKLKPYFDRKFGTVTVGNACPITDGAAMLLVASEEGLKKLGGVKPLAKIRAHAFAGLDPSRMGLGPVYASAKVLKQSGLSMADMGVVELNEAFAAQVLACQRAFDSADFAKRELGLAKAIGAVDPAKLNPNGGAIAIGHPVGATGARIALTAALEMQRKGLSHGLATLCIGGGQGGSVILEAV